MQELIGAVRIALRPEYAAHHHLRFGKALAEHIHQRNRAALADVAAARAKVRLRGLVQSLLKPGRGIGRVPARGTAGGLKSHFGLIRRVVFQQGFECLHRRGRFHQRRQAQREFEGGKRSEHIARIAHGRKAFGAGHTERGHPGAVEQGLQRVGGGGQHRLGGATAVVMRPGKALVHLVAQNVCGGTRLRQALGRHFAMEDTRQQAPGSAVF